MHSTFFLFYDLIKEIIGAFKERQKVYINIYSGTTIVIARRKTTYASQNLCSAGRRRLPETARERGGGSSIYSKQPNFVMNA